MSRAGWRSNIPQRPGSAPCTHVYTHGYARERFARLVLTLLLRMAHLAVTITVSPVGVGPTALRAFNLLGHGMRTSPHHVLYVIASGAPLDVRQRVVELRVLEWREVTAFLTRRAGSDERFEH